MLIEFDPAKRQRVLDHRGLDMARRVEVFAGPTLTSADERKVIIVWTSRGDRRRIISLRKANEREHAIYSGRMV